MRRGKVEEETEGDGRSELRGWGSAFRKGNEIPSISWKPLLIFKSLLFCQIHSASD